MKKLLFVTLIALNGGGVNAQNGGLSVVNVSPCAVHVTMYAVEAAYTTPCSIQSNQFTVPAMSTVGWNSYNLFQNVGCGSGCNGPDWYSISAGSLSSSSSTFQWTDVTWQFDCPDPILALGCNDASGTLSDGGGVSTCYGAGTTWDDGIICRNASWSPMGTTGALSDIVVSFW